MVHSQKASVPEKPFFLYVAFGATHAPHQAPKQYIDKYRGKFDAGWDVVRKEWYERQKQLGIIPPDTELAPRNPGVKPWIELRRDEQKLALRLQEAFAGFLDHTDAQIGRLIDYPRARRRARQHAVPADVRQRRQPGRRAARHGRLLHATSTAGPKRWRRVLARIDEIGTPEAFNNYPWGWAQVGNTPGKRYKQNTHGGGIRDPLIVHWPAGITDSGGIRHQFHHVTDIAPTIFEAVGASRRRSSVNGHRADAGARHQPLLHLRAGGAAEPTRKQVQYFEMFGHRGIWADGWKAVTHHEPNTSCDDDEWELYHLDSDFSECHDLAEKQPEKLRELIDLWWAEAGRNGVLPLDDRRAELWRPTNGWSDPRNRRRYVYRPPFEEIRTVDRAVARQPHASSSPPRSNAPTPTQEGCSSRSATTAAASRSTCIGDRLVFDYNLFGEHLKAMSDTALPAGKLSVGFAIERLGRVGRASVLIGDRACGSVDIPFLDPPSLGRQPLHRPRRRHRRQRRLSRRRSPSRAASTNSSSRCRRRRRPRRRRPPRRTSRSKWQGSSRAPHLRSVPAARPAGPGTAANSGR